MFNVSLEVWVLLMKPVKIDNNAHTINLTRLQFVFLSRITQKYTNWCPMFTEFPKDALVNPNLTNF